MDSPVTLDVEAESAETRRCYKCGVTRPLSMFYLAIERRQTEQQGRRTPRKHQCRFCQRESNNARLKPRQEYTDAVKLARGCADCGIRSPHPEIYDFDHLPGAEKSAEVAKLLTKGTMAELEAEVAKCEVVCSNCHRIRTRSREHSTFGRSR